MVQGYPNVGMTTAERWYEVARMVERGRAFTVAVSHVFGRSITDVVGTGWNMFYGDYSDGDSYADADMEYRHRYVMLSLFLALEAEDAENGASFDGESGYEPQPLYVIQTADVVAEEEPMVEYTHFHIGEFAVPVRQPDRRRTWNQKVADGLRKWAHWMEERF